MTSISDVNSTSSFDVCTTSIFDVNSTSTFDVYTTSILDLYKTSFPGEDRTHSPEFERKEINMNGISYINHINSNWYNRYIIISIYKDVIHKYTNECTQTHLFHFTLILLSYLPEIFPYKFEVVSFFLETDLHSLPSRVATNLFLETHTLFLKESDS